MLDIIIPSLAFFVSMPTSVLAWLGAQHYFTLRAERIRQERAAVEATKERARAKEIEEEASNKARQEQETAKREALETAMRASYIEKGHSLWKVRAVSTSQGYGAPAVKRFIWDCNCGQTAQTRATFEDECLADYEEHKETRNQIKEESYYVESV